MKAQTVLIKRSTFLSVLLVGAVIAFCVATNERADPLAQTQAQVAGQE
ncbi:MAG: hypothetical protein ACYCZQ_00780 [Burkholderiales bacterium]